jgi:hypothetical protein
MVRRPLTVISALTAACALGIGVAGPSTALPLVPVPGSQDAVLSGSNYVIPDQARGDADLSAYECVEANELPKTTRNLNSLLTEAERLLTSLETPRALNEFTSSSIYGSASQLEAAFGLAMLNGKPGGALASALRLARLAPTSAKHLVNSAVLLTRFDRPDLAYDLLIQAKQRPLRTMAGMDGEAAWQSAMGGALLEYGQFKAAQESFQKALAREPLLATARQGIARALKCQGAPALASRWQGRSQSWIDPDARMQDEADTPYWTASGIPDLIDLTQGAKSPSFLPFIPPKTSNIPLGAYSIPVADDWGRFGDRVLGGVQEPPLTREQRVFRDYVDHVATTDPVMVRLSQEGERLSEEIKEISEGSTCPSVDRYGAYWSWVGRNYELSQELADRLHLIYTAAAANTADAAFNKYLNDFADMQVDAVQFNFLLLLLTYSTAAETHAEYVREKDARGVFDEYCLTSFGGAVVEVDYSPSGPDGKGGRTNPCTKIGPLAKYNYINVSLPIPGAPVKPKIKVNCEKFSLSAKFASIGGPYAEMGLFASADYEFFTSDIVLQIGAFGEFGPLSTKTGPTVRIGPDASGNVVVKDIAFRVSSPFGSRSEPSDRARPQPGTTYILVS